VSRRRPLALLAALAALVPAGALAAGCGSDELTSVSAAEAATSTRDAETARTTMTMKMSGMGLPLPMTIKGEGVTSTSEPRMDVTIDFGPFLQAFGGAGDGKTRMLLDGGTFFVDPPAIPNLELPGGAQWITADLTEALDAMGIDAAGFGELMRISPEQQVAALEAAGSVKRVGEEEIGGVKTAHLRGTVKLEDYLGALPADRRKKAEQAIEELSKLPGGQDQDFDRPTPVDMWVDEDQLVRRISSKASMPAQNGVPGGSMEIRMDFKDFGTKLDVRPPADGDVWDATDTITKALRRAAAEQAGTTTG
jgi:hypothetical protein